MIGYNYMYTYTLYTLEMRSCFRSSEYSCRWCVRTTRLWRVWSACVTGSEEWESTAEKCYFIYTGMKRYR
jgi:hypothetical protein